MQFRQQALAKLQSPEELDLPVRFARPQGWLVLAVTVVVMAAASVWAVTGSVASTVSAPAHPHARPGQLPPAEPRLRPGHRGRRRAGPADRRRTPPCSRSVRRRATTVVRSVAAGRVTGLAATIGAIISTGANVAAVEKVADADDPLYATVYVPAENAATIPSDAAVDLTVQSAPTQQYGVLRGHVKSVDRAAQTEQQIAAFLGDSQLGEQFTKKGRPVAVLVRLDRSSATKSGYKWSSADGPPFRLELHDRGLRLDPPGGPAPDRLAAAVSATDETTTAAGRGVQLPPPVRGRRKRHRRPSAPSPRAGSGPSVRPPSSRWRPWSAAPPRSRWCSATTDGTSRWRSCASPAVSRATAPGPATS